MEATDLPGDAGDGLPTGAAEQPGAGSDVAGGADTASGEVDAPDTPAKATSRPLTRAVVVAVGSRVLIFAVAFAAAGSHRRARPAGRLALPRPG